MAANHVLLETIQLTANASSIVFNNIPQTGYTDLIIKFSSRETSGSNWNNLNLSFNGSGTYYSKSLVGTGAGVVSQASSSALDRQYANGGSTTANIFGNGEIYIPNYAGSGRKVITSNTVGENNGSSSIIGQMAGMFTGTGAITEITLNPVSTSFVTGSTFSLYGVASTTTTPVTAPKAQGGNIVANDGTYWYHAFLSSGTFTPIIPLTCDALVIAGGGGGGNNAAEYGGGGGGAGGLLAYTSQSLTNTNYTVTVGGGGVAATNGSNSQLGSLTASVGGGKGGNGSSAGSSGGSGGGGGGNATYGSATSGQGNRGGSGNGRQAGGGGGANAVGGNGSSDSGPTGTGGNGSSTYSSWGSATNTGQNVSGTYYFAGGGSGGGFVSTTTAIGAAGYGGGGSGSYNNIVPTAATANTGGGGGGGGYYLTSYAGGAGGSGIVIIRYAMA